MVAPILLSPEFLENRLAYEIQNQNYEKAIILAKNLHLYAYADLLSEARASKKWKDKLNNGPLTIQERTVINFTIKNHKQKREKHLSKMEDCNNLIKYLRNFT